jgi:hypothetical protein
VGHGARAPPLPGFSTIRASPGPLRPRGRGADAAPGRGDLAGHYRCHIISPAEAPPWALVLRGGPGPAGRRAGFSPPLRAPVLRVVQCLAWREE